LRFIKGMRQATGETIERERARGFFKDVADFSRRCRLRSEEMTLLAYAGAFSSLGLSRREALWQVAEVSRPLGTLYESLPLSSLSQKSPLPEMSSVQETAADYRATDLTAGRHLIEHLRAALAARSAELEGVFRKHMLVRGGERRDSAWYSVIDDDWPAVRAALRERLARDAR